MRDMCGAKRTAGIPLALARDGVAQRHGQRLAEGHALDEERSSLDVRAKVLGRPVRVVLGRARHREVHRVEDQRF